MKTRVGIFFFLVPLIYVGIILGLLYLQFGERSGFSERFREITVRKNTEQASENAEELRWFAAEEAATPEDRYRAELEAFLDESYRGWSDTRRRTDGTWDMGDGTARFSEETFVALHAETLRRNSTERILALHAAGTASPAGIGFLAAPLTGNLMQLDAERRQNERGTMDRIAALTDAENPDLFLISDMMTLLAARGSQQLLRRTLELAATLDPARLSLPQATGLLAAVLDANALGSGANGTLPSPLSIAEEGILTALLRTESGTFLASEDGAVDLRNQVVAGTLLQQIAEGEHAAAARAVGRALTLNALSLSQEGGFLPALLMIDSGAVAGSTGILPPESVYPFLTDTPFYPHAEIFPGEPAREGIRAWTAADVTLETGQGAYRFVFEFPAGATHQAILYGIPQFRQANLFDKLWPGTNQFQRYHSGYYYDPSTGTLYLKIRHRSDREALILTF